LRTLLLLRRFGRLLRTLLLLRRLSRLLCTLLLRRFSRLLFLFRLFRLLVLFPCVSSSGKQKQTCYG